MAFALILEKLFLFKLTWAKSAPLLSPGVEKRRQLHFFSFLLLLLVSVSCQHYFLIKITHRYVQLKWIVFLAKSREQKQFTLDSLASAHHCTCNLLHTTKLTISSSLFFLRTRKLTNLATECENYFSYSRGSPALLSLKKRQFSYVTVTNVQLIPLILFHWLESRWLLRKQCPLSSSSQYSRWSWWQNSPSSLEVNNNIISERLRKPTNWKEYLII